MRLIIITQTYNTNRVETIGWKYKWGRHTIVGFLFGEFAG
jgi:hypothetical protein